MPKTTIKVERDTITVKGDNNDLVSKLIAGCKGKVTIKTPFGIREIKHIKKEK